MQINSSIIYSIWPLLFLIICFSLPWKALHEAHWTSWRIKAHSRCNLAFRFLRESRKVPQALLSRMDHAEKSKGFRSGLLEGQSSLLMNMAVCCLSCCSTVKNKIQPLLELYNLCQYNYSLKLLCNFILERKNIFQNLSWYFINIIKLSWSERLT